MVAEPIRKTEQGVYYLIRDWVPRYEFEPYPMPRSGKPTEAVKAAAKAWRNPERIALTSVEEAETGRALPVATCFALDVKYLAARLPEPERTIFRLWFYRAVEDPFLIARKLGICRCASTRYRDREGYEREGCGDPDQGGGGHEAVVLRHLARGVRRVANTLYPHESAGDILNRLDLEARRRK